MRIVKSCLFRELFGKYENVISMERTKLKKIERQNLILALIWRGGFVKVEKNDQEMMTFDILFPIL